MTADETTRRALEALEARRLAATAASDTATLEDIYAPDMMMVHFAGKEQSRDDYIANIAVNPRDIEIGPMRIMVYGDVALMTGAHNLTRTTEDGERRLVRSYATRVLKRSDGGWRYVYINVAPMDVASA